MRVDSIEVHNFRGLRHASAAGLGTSAVITVSGPNGAGKSLLFEAITFLWRSFLPWPGQYNLHVLIGPWADTALIRASLALTDEERTALTAFAQARGAPTGSAPATIACQVEIAPADQFGSRRVSADEWSLLLFDPLFAQQQGFAHIDYLPADRSIQRGEQAQVNPALLSVEQAEGLRQQVFNSFVQQRQILTLTGVQPFLASLDYLDMLRDRQAEARTGDFEAITEPFQEATGKTIHRPRIDPSAPFGAVLEVETPSRQRHTLDQLSSGEQEVLALAYYIRRLSASGGLLLIDEPELHLHPALQRSLFAVMENLAERAQIWIVTHSPQLVTTAPLSAVLHMTPENGDDRNQLVKASDEEARAQLLTDIGFNPVEVLQSDCLVVVEGEVDARRLPAAFPLPLGRAALFVAGSAAGVEATARSLISGQTPRALARRAGP